MEKLSQLLEDMVTNKRNRTIEARITSPEYALLKVKLDMIDNIEPLINKLIDLPIPHSPSCAKVIAGFNTTYSITCTCGFFELKETIMEIARMAGYWDEENIR